MSTSVELDSVTLAVSGMSCAGCAASVEKALLKVPGVKSASVNLVLGRASVTIEQKLNTSRSAASDPESNVTALIAALESVGYGAADLNARTASQSTVSSEQLVAYRALKLKALSAVLLAAPLVFPMLVGPFSHTVMLPGPFQFVLASLLQFIHGSSFYSGALRALRARQGNMDVLVAIGTSAAWLLSTYTVFTSSTSENLYFESSGVVIALVLLGKWIEASVKLRSLESLAALHALRPERAYVYRESDWKEVSPDDLVIGDLIRIRAGEVIPVDGKICAGESSLDESLITGESLPVMRTVGQNVSAGALSTDGLLEVEVLAKKENSTLERIIQLVEEAQSKKAPIQKFVDKISAVFVPVVLVLAVGTFLIWSLIGEPREAILHAVAVLVVACPCALGLATPTAILAGTGLAARMGVLIRDVEVLEKAGLVTAVALDKTGTLTRGRPVLRVQRTWLNSDEQSLRTAAALQAGSTHPLGQALLRKAAELNLDLPRVKAWQDSPGRGVRGQIEGQFFSLLSVSAAMEKVDSAGRILIETETAENSSGAYAVSVLLTESDLSFEPIAIFFFEDEPRQHAARAINLLEEMNLETVMLSGDNAVATERLAKKWGIKNWRAEVRPEDKLQAIRDFESRGLRIAMVGDGINDAPALAAATLGIAMGSGTDAAIRSAGMTLMRPDPRLVAAAIWVARRTTRKIHQNLFWAFAYNVIALPLAAAGFLSPIIAGAAMALSSVSVVTSSLLLRRDVFPLDESKIPS